MKNNKYKSKPRNEINHENKILSINLNLESGLLGNIKMYLLLSALIIFNIVSYTSHK